MNKKVILKCSEISYEGLGVSREFSKPIFVPNFFIDEIAEVIITKEYSKYAFGKVNKLIIKSKHRNNNELLCFNSAPLINLSYNEQIKQKSTYLINLLSRNLGIESTLISDFLPSSEIYNYRNKRKYPLYTKENKLYFGEYINDSQIINQNQDNLIQNKENLNKTLRIIINKINNYTQEYKKYNNLNFFKEITLRINNKNQTQVLIKIHKEFDIPKTLLNDLYDINNLIELNIQKEESILNLFQKEPFIMKLNYMDFKVNIDSFFQINDFISSKIFKLIKNKIKKYKFQTFIDLFCGVGVISQLSCDINQNIIGVDITRSSVHNAILNAKNNKFTHFKYLVGDAFEKIKQENIDYTNSLVIIDPPRSGLNSKLIEWLLKFKYIIYISCDPRTLTRDLKQFLSYNFKINYIQGFDMFPNTFHVETVVFLEKDNMKIGL
ncbi:23S rRNA (uracil(1939)-C(5))-methyltransferase RlmD [Mycoplasmopsis felis]|uniref:23S rRNA (uracil(1939)-C(5))-methyltransferase RlmD n=1 Tax=Mycoplasmopsis felis TaxID=33923 RepID=UPI002286555B|nr:23S rRNA (uracil(1939)-C(5))-methyltransferase RlmD [Mycoplasmopsis felis]WAM02161.1 23S rRNA (uracil(1939)-C(5))-methyltransferase RlmD [Mycoplasmopsis felis]